MEKYSKSEEFMFLDYLLASSLLYWYKAKRGDYDLFSTF